MMIGYARVSTGSWIWDCWGWLLIANGVFWMLAMGTAIHWSNEPGPKDARLIIDVLREWWRP